MNKQFRPNLTEYEWCAELLAEKLNEESLNKMSKTDAVKIALERALQSLCPEVIVDKKRKLYQTLKF
jgi:hypothetical protein